MSNPENTSNPNHHMHPDTEALSAYIDGALTASERITLERHLQVCQRCAEELQSLRWTVHLLAAVPPVAVPHSFAVRAADLEKQPIRQPSRWPGWLLPGLQWATAAIAFLAVLMFAIDLLDLVPSPARPLSTAAPQMAAAPAQSMPAEPEAPEAATPRKQTMDLASGETAKPTQSNGKSARALTEAEPPTSAGRSQAEAAESTAPQKAPAPLAAKPAAPATPPEEQAFQPATEALSQKPDQALSSSPIWIRGAEIGLAVLFLILLGLTVWMRRQTGA